MIDITKIKPGDKITVELVVRNTEKSHDGETIVITRPSGPSSWSTQHGIDPISIVGHTPKPVEIVGGMRFAIDRIGELTEVIAVAEGQCMVRYPGGSFGIMSMGSAQNFLKYT